MVSFLIFLLAMHQLQRPVYSEIDSNHRFNQNALSTPDGFESIVPLEPTDDDSEIDSSDIPFVKSGPDQTEVEFHHPINSVNIDYSRNAIVLKFRKQPQSLDSDEMERRKSLEANFMRFGRDPGQNFMRFGKRAMEQMPNGNSILRSGQSGSERFERSSENFDKSGNVGLRDSRGDNFMRFGRSPKHDYMRFGRNPKKDFMRLGRSAGQDYMRFGRSPGQDYMRFGRSPSQDYMRFGRNPGQDYMRFGRSPGQDYMRFGRSSGQDYMRFGRNPGQDYMRFGRSSGQDYMRLGRNPGQDYMRFGRDPGQNYMRFGRAAADFMRLGRGSDKNFMRFGRPDNFMRFGRGDADANADKSSNFMRFGRMNENTGPVLEEKDDKDGNHTSTRLLQKNDIKEAAKLLHETDHSDEESNPMDKAIEVLFSKQDNDQTIKHKSFKEDSSQEMDY